MFSFRYTLVCVNIRRRYCRSLQATLFRFPVSKSTVLTSRENFLVVALVRSQDSVLTSPVASVQVNLTTSDVYVTPLILDYLLRFYIIPAMSYKHYLLPTYQQITIVIDHITGSFPTACHISLIVILLLECCFVTVIDCTDCIHFLLFIALYFIGVCIFVYNCGLTVVLLKTKETLDLSESCWLTKQSPTSIAIDSIDACTYSGWYSKSGGGTFLKTLL